MRSYPINEVRDALCDGRSELEAALGSLDSANQLRVIGISLALDGYTVGAARDWLQSMRPHDSRAHYAISKAWHGIDFADGQWWH